MDVIEMENIEEAPELGDRLKVWFGVAIYLEIHYY